MGAAMGASMQEECGVVDADGDDTEVEEESRRCDRAE